MRLVTDLTTAARIRQAGLELFAEQGVAATSVRAIATRADVSPALILHHFGSKDGLRQAIDDHVIAFIGETLDEFSAHATDEAGINAFARIANQPAIVEYAARSIVSDGDAGAALFDRIVAVGLEGFEQMRQLGFLKDLDNPRMVALYIISADIGVLLLRSHIQRHIGIDPLGPEGIDRWARAEVDVIGSGIFADSPPPPSTKADS